MNPFADFTYFGLLLYAVIPTLLLGLIGRANRAWALAVTLGFLVVHFYPLLDLRPNLHVRELYLVLAYTFYQWLIAKAQLTNPKSRAGFWLSLALTILPLVAAKFLPLISPQTIFGFAGISYVTFRALDVTFSIRDQVVKAVPPVTYFSFLFFFSTVSSGPIDRFRRFTADWQRRRTRTEFLTDLDLAVVRLFRGFLYKFIIAALIRTYWMDKVALGTGWHVWSYMYAYTFYLFFDFAGYSAFAISLSHLFGIRTPENFNRPFLAPNIRDFWNRWHISLSFWFRDHIYMRFLLAVAKGKYFKSKHTASYLGLFLTFGIMGLWHGSEWYYILYGIYHAVLLCSYDAFARWNKTRHYLTGGPLIHGVNILLTFHAVAFGLLLFSGRLAAHPPPAREELVEKLTCTEIAGFIWDRENPNANPQVDIYIDDQFHLRVLAADPRPDLAERGYGTGQHGFHAAMPPRVMDGKKHAVRVTLVGPSRELVGPTHLTCDLDEDALARARAATPAPTATPVPAIPAPAPQQRAAEREPTATVPAPATPH